MKNKPIGGFLMNTFKRSIAKILFVCLLIGQVQTAQAGWYDYVQSAGSWAKNAISSVSSYFSGQTEQAVEVVRQNRETAIFTGIVSGIGVAAVAFALWKRYQSCADRKGKDRLTIEKEENHNEHEEQIQVLKNSLNKIVKFTKDTQLVAHYSLFAPIHSKQAELVIQRDDIIKQLKENNNQDEEIKAYNKEVKALKKKIEDVKAIPVYSSGEWSDCSFDSDPDNEQGSSGSGASGFGGPTNLADQSSQEPMCKEEKEPNQKRDCLDQNQPQGQKFDPSGDVLFGSEQIKAALADELSQDQAEEEQKKDEEFQIEEGDWQGSMGEASLEDSEEFQLLPTTGSIIAPSKKTRKENKKKVQQYVESCSLIAPDTVQSFLAYIAKEKDVTVDLKKAQELIVLGGCYYHQLISGKQDHLPQLPQIEQRLLTRVQTPKCKSEFKKQCQEYQQAINAIIWFLYAEGASRGELFKQGTIILEDPNLKVLSYLKNYVEIVSQYQEKKDAQAPVWQYTLEAPVRWLEYLQITSRNSRAYPRESSHLKQYEQQHYGLELCFEKEKDVVLFPTGQPHLLFGNIDGHRIILKPEDHGIRVYDYETGFLSHVGGFAHSLQRKGQKGANEQEGMRKERFPTYIKEKIAKWKKEGLQIEQEIVSVAQFWQLLQERKSNFAYMREFEKELLANLRHVDKRFGNEVYFTQEDLAPSAYCYAMCDEDQQDEESSQKQIADYLTFQRATHRKFYELRRVCLSNGMKGEKTKKVASEFSELVHSLSDWPLVQLALHFPKETRAQLVEKQVLFEKIAPQDVNPRMVLVHDIFNMGMPKSQHVESKKKQTTAYVSPLKDLAMRVCTQMQVKGNHEEIATVPEESQAKVAVELLRLKPIGQLQLT